MNPEKLRLLVEAHPDLSFEFEWWPRGENWIPVGCLTVDAKIYKSSYLCKDMAHLETRLIELGCIVND